MRYKGEPDPQQPRPTLGPFLVLGAPERWGSFLMLSNCETEAVGVVSSSSTASF